MQVLSGWLESERVDSDGLLPKPEFDISPVQERRQLPIAVAEIQHDREGVVLLRASDQEVQQKALAAAGSPEHQRVSDVLNVEVIVERSVVRRLQHRQGTRQQRRSGRPVIDREEKAEIGGMRFE